jgi:hypothetical protein
MLKKLTAVLSVTLFSFLIISGCGKSQKSKTFTVGFDADFKPYGYVENKEKTTALGEIEGVEQATVGYLPWIMLQKLSSDCRSDEYKVYYSWLSKSCLGEDCQYYAPPLK